MNKSLTATPANESPAALKESRGATGVTRSATRWYDAPDRFVIFVTERAIQLTSAQRYLCLCV